MSAELFVEPTGEENRAGLTDGVANRSPYEKFMDSEEIPIYKGIGFHNVRELELKPWSRLGGNGAYLYLDGIEDIKGMYVLEIPGQGSLNPERHLYHAFHLVIEGRGTTEIWRDGKNKSIVEWGPGSLFYLPPNVDHRLVNATKDRVLILASTNAPPIINLLRNQDFIFHNDFAFNEHFSGDASFYKYDEKVYAVPSTKRAQARTNFYPDIVNSDLPLDNQRAPGYRRIQPAWSGFENDYCGFISQYPTGRYSRAHHHEAGAVLVCLRGAGYTFNWPVDYGTTPWKDGHGDRVRYVDYVPGGLVSAAPGGGRWFHQHFGVADEPLRVINYWGGPGVRTYRGFDEKSGKSGNLNISQGGRSIGYGLEDPFVRETFESRLGEFGHKSTMANELYAGDR